MSCALSKLQSHRALACKDVLDKIMQEFSLFRETLNNKDQRDIPTSSHLDPSMQ